MTKKLLTFGVAVWYHTKVAESDSHGEQSPSLRKINQETLKKVLDMQEIA